MEMKEYFAVNFGEGKPIDAQIPMGGDRRQDAQGNVVFAPFKMIYFKAGFYRTDDPAEQEHLDRMVARQGSMIISDRAKYEDAVLPKQVQDRRAAAREKELVEEVNRLKAELGAKPEPAARIGRPPKASTPAGE